MSSGSLLLLLGLLSLWAELTPVSGRNRPKHCYLPAETGPCLAYMPRFYYDSTSKQCREFFYGGCRGNANNFKTSDECRYTCVEKRGRCPQSQHPQHPQHPHQRCQNDFNCPGRQKCCRKGSMTECRNPA